MIHAKDALKIATAHLEFSPASLDEVILSIAMARDTSGDYRVPNGTNREELYSKLIAAGYTISCQSRTVIRISFKNAK